MKKRWFCLSALLLAIVLAVSTVPTAMAVGGDAVTVSAPEGAGPSISVWLEDGVPYYQITNGSETLVESSKLGLSTSLGELKDGFTMGEVTRSSGDTTWKPVVGEQSQYRDYYNQASIPLTSNGISITLEVRAYQTGVAFRYLLPQSEEDYTIDDEYTQFVFPAGTVANVHQGGNQTVPKQVAVESFSDTMYMRPLTLQYESGAAMTICEANLDNYGVMTLTKDPTTARALKAEYVSYKPSRPAGSEAQGPEITVSEGSPTATPWRTFVIGKSEIDLPANSSIVMNLNEAPDEETFEFSQWVEPGSCLRAASGMNTTAIEAIVDQAAEKGIKYVLLDTGWYGPEYDVNCDPRLDPTLLDTDNSSDKILLEQYFAQPGDDTFLPNGEGVFNTRGQGFDVYKELGTPGTFQTNVDIPAICDYANQKDVGIILYVNGVYLPDSSGRNRFTTDELFTKFEKWGVKGVKPGFVHVRAQKFEAYMQEVVEAAAKHHLIMTVHDEYVTTGIERTFPNLFCTEGILGDEGIGKTTPQVAEDIATLFTRTIQEPADHTFCWPGKATKAYALASPLMFRTGMSVLYWYTNPNSVPAQDKDKMGFWEDFPGTWDESLYLEGSMYEYATYARRSGETWYVGSLSAVERTLEVPLTFLEEGVTYVADIYADGADADAMAGWNSAAKNQQTLENMQYLVTSETTLKRDLQYGFGYAVKLTKATAEDLQNLDPYSPALELLKTRLEEYRKLNAQDYTTDTWNVLAAAMSKAQAIVDDPTSYEEAEIEAAVTAMDEAAEGLLTSAPLLSALAQVSRLTDYHYTEASWNALAVVAAEAEELLQGSFSQEDLNTMTQRLTDAISNLQANPDAEIGETVYLSDIAYDSKSWSVNEGQQGQIKKDIGREGKLIALNLNGEKTDFPKGISLDAPGELYYNIGGLGYELFESYIGVDANKPEMGTIIFRVYGDGELLYESRMFNTGSDDGEFISVPVAGVSELRLESDMVENRNGDWAVWADAKFVTYKDPDASLEAILVDGKALPEFDPDTMTYYYPAPEDGTAPTVSATCADGASAQVTQAAEAPGMATISVTRGDGSTAEYQVVFCKMELEGYLSDISNGDIISNTLHYGTVYRDKSCKDDEMALTAADGESKLLFEKGVGLHASSSTDSTVVFNIAGKGYERFEAYVGIRYGAHEEELNQSYDPPRSSVIFRIYVDNEVKPRYESGLMKSRTPAEFVSIDITGASILRITVDANGDQSADHANMGDAKFLTYVKDTTHQHVFDQEVAETAFLKTEATCTEAAVYYKSCECGAASTTETFTSGQPLGHDFSKAWSSNETNHWHACSRCDAKDNDKAHTPGAAATETTPQTCTVCGYIIAPATGHVTHTPDTSKWYFDATSHWHQCTGCGEQLDVANHTGGEATCVSKAVCEVCGAAYGETNPNNHKHVQLEGYEAATIFTSGYSGDWVCQDCGKTVKKGEVIPRIGSGIIIPVNPSTPSYELPFVDVPEGEWYYESVYYAWDADLIDGTSATTFRPDHTLTVAQAIKLAAALHQLENDGRVTLANGKTNWYDTYVAYAVKEGIIESKYQSYTQAQMNAPATRREFVHILHGALDDYAAINAIGDNAIPDVKTGDTYAAEIYDFYRAGILTGSNAKGTFHPESSIKRSEVAAILVRMYDESMRLEKTL